AHVEDHDGLALLRGGRPRGRHGQVPGVRHRALVTPSSLRVAEPTPRRLVPAADKCLTPASGTGRPSRCTSARPRAPDTGSAPPRRPGGGCPTTRWPGRGCSSPTPSGGL